MSNDNLLFQLSNEVENQPNVFLRKDWLNIMDNQAQNYQNNISVIDTSQLANSNKYMSYREGYLVIPILMSYRGYPSNGLTLRPADYSMGLKNWYGTIIHSFTVEFNGTQIVQQIPFINLWNTFKLMTTLSWSDIDILGATIGFYPDVPDSYTVHNANSVNGFGLCNNSMGQNYRDTTGLGLSFSRMAQPSTSTFNAAAVGGNAGLTMRTKWINYNPDAPSGLNTIYGDVSLSKSNASLIWKSHISTKFESGPVAGQRGTLQISITAIVYLKHLHSFFDNCPLMKGVFFKLTMNLNNARCTINSTASTQGFLSCSESISYVGGTQPILIPSSFTVNQSAIPAAGSAYVDIMVGSICYNENIINSLPNNIENGKVAKSVYLFIPAYTFNPTFETAYLSNRNKTIKYTDVFQYDFNITGTTLGNNFNYLITNGIKNIKSILMIPVSNLPFEQGGNKKYEYLSPFSPCGGGTTYPMVSFSNLNIQISGQNVFYSMQKYNFEEFNHQLYAYNSINGGFKDGVSSGLVDFMGFQTSYSYYYVNVDRMLPTEEEVPKSVQIFGTSYCPVDLKVFIFVEYKVNITIDLLTGARI